MKSMNIFLMAQGAEGGGASVFLMWGIVIIIFYFFMIRPQQKRQKDAKAFREGLKKGDKVVTIGGIHGKVDTVKENTVIITVEDGIKLKVEKSALSATAQVNETELANKA
jgi:preprotein translocase subunit YajC